MMVAPLYPDLILMIMDIVKPVAQLDTFWYDSLAHSALNSFIGR